MIRILLYVLFVLAVLIFWPSKKTPVNFSSIASTVNHSSDDVSPALVSNGYSQGSSDVPDGLVLININREFGTKIFIDRKSVEAIGDLISYRIIANMADPSSEIKSISTAFVVNCLNRTLIPKATSTYYQSFASGSLRSISNEPVFNEFIAWGGNTDHASYACAVVSQRNK